MFSDQPASRRNKLHSPSVHHLRRNIWRVCSPASAGLTKSLLRNLDDVNVQLVTELQSPSAESGFIRSSIQQMIPIVPLPRLVTEITNQPLHIFHSHPKRRASL